MEPYYFMAGVLTGAGITTIILHALFWKRYRRLRDHAAYQDIKVVRIYRNGVLQSQSVEPLNPFEKEVKGDDGTLPLPLEVQPGTRMSEIQERKH